MHSKFFLVEIIIYFFGGCMHSRIFWWKLWFIFWWIFLVNIMIYFLVDACIQMTKNWPPLNQKYDVGIKNCCIVLWIHFNLSNFIPFKMEILPNDFGKSSELQIGQKYKRNTVHQYNIVETYILALRCQIYVSKWKRNTVIEEAVCKLDTNTK